MADSKVEIQVTANTDEAKRSLADLESAADRAMDAGANSAKKFAKGLDEVGESAKLSAREIKGFALYQPYGWIVSRVGYLFNTIWQNYFFTFTN